MPYGEFAYIYDTLMSDVDYIQWTDAIQQLFGICGVSPKTIADLACGTGNITINLFKKGYDVIGIDISEDMLHAAKAKCRKLGIEIPFVCQDIIDFTVHRPLDAITCICDGVNYILTDDDLQEFFNRVYKFLKPNGVFIFDISSYYKLSKVLGNNVMFDNSEDISFIWNNSFNKESGLLSIDISFFIKKGDLYWRVDEEHIQRAYKTEEILKALKAANFRRINYYDGFSLSKPVDETQRILFCAQKQ